MANIEYKVVVVKTILGEVMTELAKDGWRFTVHLASKEVKDTNGFDWVWQHQVLMERYVT